MKIHKPDSLIFDMDGTLWDASDTYLKAWNEGLSSLDHSVRITKTELFGVMGWEKKAVLNKLLPNFSNEGQEEIYKTVNNFRSQFLKSQGGKLYYGVHDGLSQLSKKYTLFIVSNCPAGVIEIFIENSNIANLVTDSMAHGSNGASKSDNIKFLITKHKLLNPLYIGDTDIDRQESEMAGIGLAPYKSDFVIFVFV